MMRYTSHFFFCNFAAPHIEFFIYLSGVRRDDLAFETARKLDRQRGFTRGRRSHDDEYFRLLHAVTLLQNEALLKYDARVAGVAEWYTRTTQNRLGASPCGFKSRLRHKRIVI